MLILRPPSTSTLFPYTTLFRSDSGAILERWRDDLDDDLEDFSSVYVKIHPRGPSHLSPADVRASASDEPLWGLPVEERSEEHTSELQSHSDLVCRLLLEKKKKN